jgi:hypothetical protein
MSIGGTSEDPVDMLQRWEDAGAIWRVVSRDTHRVEVALLTCTGGEEVDRLHSSDPELLAFVGERWSSEQ